jgi:hypothetical protein
VDLARRMIRITSVTLKCPSLGDLTVDNTQRICIGGQRERLGCVTTSHQGEENERKIREPTENRCREAKAPGMKGSQTYMAMKGTNQGDPPARRHSGEGYADDAPRLNRN